MPKSPAQHKAPFELPPFPEVSEKHRDAGITHPGMEICAEWCADVGRITGAFKVFPCAEGEKRPRNHGWQNQATWDAGEVWAMWRKCPGENIGLAIQPGFVAIDADLYKEGAKAELARSIHEPR